MGKSKSIQEQQKENQAFQDYLNDIQEKLKKKAADHNTEFEQKIKAYYGDDYSKVIRIGTGEKYDFRQIDEVTMKNLGDVIQNTVDSIFPGPKQDQEQSEDVKNAITQVKDFRGMAAAMATNLITGAMNILSTSSQVTYNYSLKSESVCPGLSLHILVANDAYTDKRWFSNTEIVESYVRYELVFSYTQVRAEMDIGYFNTQLTAIQNMENAVNKLYDKYSELLADMDIPEEKLESMEKRIDLAKKQITKAREEVNAAIQAAGVNKTKRLMEERKIAGRRAERIVAFLQSAGSVAHE